MKRSARHIITTWVVFISFFSYSLTVPTIAYADDTPESTSQPNSIDGTISIPMPSCDILGIPSLDVALPTVGTSGQIYDIGSRYRILDTTTSQQLSLEGTFLTRPAAASLLVGLQNIENTWQIELNRILAYNNACWQYRVSLLESEVRLRDSTITTLNTEMARRLEIRDEHINILNSRNNPPRWYESGEFWFAMGVVAGIGITVGAGYALGQVNK